MASRVVCISRAVGAGGEEVGRRVAERLGFSYVDEEIIRWAAEKGGVSAEDIADTEQRKSALRRLLDEMAKGAAAETFALAGVLTPGAAAATSDDFRGLIQAAIEDRAGQGDVVFVAHAAAFALGGRPDVLRVLVTASPQTRAGRLAKSEGLPPKQAEKEIKDSDAARASYLRRFYEVDHELPTHYDLVVNTDAMDPERAAELVVRAAS